MKTTGFFGHNAVGKTSLVEAILYHTKQTSRLGHVDDGNSVCDFDSEEKDRHISIHAAMAHYPWKNMRIHVIDTPGYADFIGDVIAALHAVDSAIICINGTSGVEVRTHMVFKEARARRIPVAFFINKLDKEHADFHTIVSELRSTFGKQCVPIALPIGKAEIFSDVISLVDPEGRDRLIHADDHTNFDTYREKLMDAAADTDDALIEKYLEGTPLSHDEVVHGISKGIEEGTLFPILCGSATASIGIDTLLDFIAEELPSPNDHGPVAGFHSSQQKKPDTRLPEKTAPFAAYVFKSIMDPFTGQLTVMRILSGTVTPDIPFYNSSTGKDGRFGHISFLLGKNVIPTQKAFPGDIIVASKLKNIHIGNTLCDPAHPFYRSKATYPPPVAFAALHPESKSDEDKLGDILHRLEEEDPTFRAQRNHETKELIASGMGTLHLDIVAHQMKEKFNTQVILKTPRVAYRETIKTMAKAEYKHKKQSGGHGQYGHVCISMHPRPRGAGFLFTNHIVGGSIPKQFIPGVEKGVKEALEHGELANYPVMDVEVQLHDGSFHSVDSSELAFKIAGTMAFKKAFKEARPILLEPIMHVSVTVPDAYFGDITGHLNSKRGKIQGITPQGTYQQIEAEAPQSEMFDYVGQLRSMTSGRGAYHMSFSHYAEVPSQQTTAILAAETTESQTKGAQYVRA